MRKPHLLRSFGIYGNHNALADFPRQCFNRFVPYRAGGDEAGSGNGSTQCEANGCVLFPQPLAPPVEGRLLQSSLTTVCADRLAAAFLLRDALAP